MDTPVPDESVTTVEAPNGETSPTPIKDARFTPVASYLHTAATIVIMLGVALMTMMSAKQLQQARSPWVTYLPTIIWLLLLFAFVTAGLQRRNISLREIFGAPWASFDDVI